MHEGDRHTALTDGCCYALHRSGADIADGEDARGARFESERLAIGLPLPRLSMDSWNCPWADVRIARRWPIRTAQWWTRICP
jgi:hypothetical protein